MSLVVIFTPELSLTLTVLCAAAISDAQDTAATKAAETAIRRAAPASRVIRTSILTE